VTRPDGTADIGGLVGGRVFQIAFVVRDLDQALERYSRMFAATSWRGWTFGASLHRSAAYRGRPADFSSRLALSDTSPQFELIEPLEGESIHRDWLEVHGEGVHHLGVIVESVDAVLDRMERAGFPVVQSGSGFGADGDGVYAYFDTRDLLGLMLEAVEPPARMPPVDFAWPP
jgi:catechol 2,3-dioxygenase-like lactoylglutathione lyase family enzyme